MMWESENVMIERPKRTKIQEKQAPHDNPEDHLSRSLASTDDQERIHALPIGDRAQIRGGAETHPLTSRLPTELSLHRPGHVSGPGCLTRDGHCAITCRICREAAAVVTVQSSR